MKSKSITPLWGGVLLFVGFFLFCGRAEAGIQTKEVPIERVGTAITVSVSTSAWTQANNSTSYLQNRAGFRITNPDGNNDQMYWLCHASAPSEAITVKINEVDPGTNATAACGPGMNLYLLATHTAAENAQVWEIGQ